MTKRILAGVLWFLAVSYAWNVLAWLVGLPETPGLLLGAVAAYLMGADPLGRIWTAAAARRQQEAPALDTAAAPAR